MQQERAHLAFSALTLILASSAAMAAPNVNATIEHYPIRGDSADELRHQMNKKGPKHDDGKRYDGYTSWHVKWRFRWRESDGQCAITSVDTQVDVTSTLPRWVEAKAADEDLQAKWNDFYRALKKHERGHKRIGIKAAEAIEAAIADMESRPDCKRLERQANTLGHQLLKKYRKRDDAFDQRTNYGQRNGAVFP